ncbi:MAG: 30S ribosomal protein S6 [Phycisphaerae bacterium]
MSEITRTYEGMFLLDAGNPNADEAVAPVRNVLARSDAEVVSLKPWDERKLAYEIKGRRRGLYVLTYFKADPEKVKDIERDVQLDEKVLRVLILKVDDLTDEMINADTPALAAKSSDEESGSSEEEKDQSKKSEEAKSEEKPEEKKPEAKEEDKSDEGEKPEEDKKEEESKEEPTDDSEKSEDKAEESAEEQKAE